MADRVGRPVNSNGGGAPSFPPAKSQMYGANRPVYRPKPTKRRHGSGRSCCCSCCLWVTFFLIALIFLVAIAGAIFYFIYRPHRPSFSVTALRLSSFNVSSSNLLSSTLDVSVAAQNPNKKLVYIYDPISISVSSGGVGIGDGSFPGFSHDAGNTTLLKASVKSSSQSVDPVAAADLKKKSTLTLDILLDSKAGVKVGGLKTKKIGVKVTCSGVSVAVPKGKKSPPSSQVDASCEVKLRIKFWKWYL